MGYRIEFTEKCKGEDDYVYYSKIYKRYANALRVAQSREHRNCWRTVTTRVIPVQEVTGYG